MVPKNLIERTFVFPEVYNVTTTINREALANVINTLTQNGAVVCPLCCYRGFDEYRDAINGLVNYTTIDIKFVVGTWTSYNPDTNELTVQIDEDLNNQIQNGSITAIVRPRIIGVIREGVFYPDRIVTVDLIITN